MALLWRSFLVFKLDKVLCSLYKKRVNCESFRLKGNEGGKKPDWDVLCLKLSFRIMIPISSTTIESQTCVNIELHYGRTNKEDKKSGYILHFRPNLWRRLDLRALHRLRAAGLREGGAQRHQQD